MSMLSPVSVSSNFTETSCHVPTSELPVFVYFLEIHPYANGNGHLARFFLIGYLARYGVFLARWPMHPRPSDPPYSDLIRRYRRGDRNSLERFVMSCI